MVVVGVLMVLAMHVYREIVHCTLSIATSAPLNSDSLKPPFDIFRGSRWINDETSISDSNIPVFFCVFSFLLCGQ